MHKIPYLSIHLNKKEIMRKKLLNGIWVFNVLAFAVIVYMLLACTPAKEAPVATDSTSIEAVDTVVTAVDTLTVVDSIEVK
jgi:hypothetical protein